MHDRFHEYSHNVARYVRHATGKEKATLRKELEDHMEDHAQALLDGGCPEDHAYRVAVESMGDPETVGRALNKEYPLRWLILSRLVWMAVLVAALMLVLPAAAARNLSRNLHQYHLISVLGGLVCGIGGLMVSYYLGASTGASITVLLALWFFLSLLFKGKH